MSPLRPTSGNARALALLLLALATAVNAAPARAAKPVEFNRDIRPILSDNCFYCHGPDKNHRKAKLRLDVREDALAKEAFVPGKPEESELINRIFTTNPDDLMPPPEAHKTLTPVQKELFRRWIAEGAKYEPHWAYITPKRPEEPLVKNTKWTRNPIDAFILQPLEERKIKPSPEADRRTLLRRLSLDLTGLPPTPEEVAAFVADKDPQAYEKQVERLLQSRHYGERMAVPWLDAVRYADTVGYHGDQNQNIFPYRDYVIESFNQNKPFDQFTIEQLAGDLIPNPTQEQLIATGFNRLNMMTREGGAQPKEYLAKYAADRVRTVGTAWLGSTLGCCECHDHKFDPFTMKDFYSLASYFSDVKQWGVYSDYRYTPNPDLKGWNNDYPFPPEIEVDSAYLKGRRDKFQLRIDELVAEAASKRKADAKAEAAFTAWRDASLGFLKENPSGWVTPEARVFAENKPAEKGKAKAKAKRDTDAKLGDAKETKPAAKDAKPAPPFLPAKNITNLVDGALLFSGKTTTNDRVELRVSAGWLSALRLELLPHEQHKDSILRDGSSALVSLTATLKAKGGKETKLAFRHAEATEKEERYSNGSSVIGVAGAWKINGAKLPQAQSAVWHFDRPVQAGEGDVLLVSLNTNPFGAIRISVSPFADQDPLAADTGEVLARVLQSRSQPGPADRLRVEKIHLLSTAANADAFAAFKTYHRELLQCRDGKTMTLVTVAWEPRPARVLPRGNWQDESGEVVTPRPPAFLPQRNPADERRQTRLDLARWIVSPDNPLTSRVLMNRTWKQLFGVGICNSIEDVGAQGEPPSHPELLDWLAVEFRESGWNLKHMVRLMVTSAAYRQSSNLRKELLETDPNNRLLASQNPRRLEAEFVRDNALAIAGLINLDYGGPSAKPYQPGGYYESLQFPDRDYIADKDERQYRRGLYMHWQRTFLHPMLANFDAPSREDCTGLRNISNTPQQALTLLNDPSFVEAARVFAQSLLAASRSDDQRLELAFQRALARSPKSAEKQSLKRLLAQQLDHYRRDAEETKKAVRVGQTPVPPALDEAELAAWTSVCRVIVNLHETITRY
ncbi:MAG: PSD1 and planctomycete cytochrome C domain-containing protein [Verrucomicrobiota bacterium]